MCVHVCHFAVFVLKILRFVLAIRMWNFCSNYCDNAEQVLGLKTSHVAKAEMALWR